MWLGLLMIFILGMCAMLLLGYLVLVVASICKYFKQRKQHHVRLFEEIGVSQLTEPKLIPITKVIRQARRENETHRIRPKR